jgi:hypothetical protein
MGLSLDALTEIWVSFGEFDGRFEILDGAPSGVFSIPTRLELGHDAFEIGERTFSGEEEGFE